VKSKADEGWAYATLVGGYKECGNRDAIFAAF
jgi:hypothetical protein